MVTFSRGITGFMILLLAFLLNLILVAGSNSITLLFYDYRYNSYLTHTSYQTGGLIDKRYANQDAAGRAKESQFTGREDVAQNEIVAS
jgi:hypothetical protein